MSNLSTLWPHQAYIVGLYANVQQHQATLTSEFAKAAATQQAIATDLRQLCAQLQLLQQQYTEQQLEQKQLSQNIAQTNAKLAELVEQQNVAQLKLEQFTQALASADSQAVQASRRRRQAAQAVAMRRLREQHTNLTQTAMQLHQRYQEVSRLSQQHHDQIIKLGQQMLPLQNSCIPLKLYTERFFAIVATAHCAFALAPNRQNWYQQLAFALTTLDSYLIQLHTGFYNDEALYDHRGLSAHLVAEAMIIALVVGEQAWVLRLRTQLRRLYGNQKVLHELSSVFQAWCLGLYLDKKWHTLTQILDYHQHTPGLIGLFSQAFILLMAQDLVGFQQILPVLIASKWHSQQHLDPALGLIDLSAMALLQIAHTWHFNQQQLTSFVPLLLLQTQKNL